jgi:hypothetical protein
MLKHIILLSFILGSQVVIARQVTKQKPIEFKHTNPYVAAKNVQLETSLLPIIYNGGPVMTADSKVHLLWYGTFSFGTKKIVNEFISNLNSSDWWSINRQYKAGNIYIGNSTDLPVSKKSLSTNDIEFLISKALYRKKVPVSENDQYLILTDKNIQVYHQKPGTFEFCKDVCGWHTYMYYKEKVIKYSFVGSTLRCNVCGASMLAPSANNSPNNNYEADTILSTIGHELAETASDPMLNAWYDKDGAENADKCSWQFGNVKVGTSVNINGLWNVVVGKKKYLIQMNWGIKPTQRCYQ